MVADRDMIFLRLMVPIEMLDVCSTTRTIDIETWRLVDDLFNAYLVSRYEQPWNENAGPNGS